MQYIFKGLVFLFTLIQIISIRQVQTYEVLILLVIVAGNIYRDKYRDSFLILIGETILITLLVLENPGYSILYSMVVYELIYKQFYSLIFIVLIGGIYLIPMEEVPLLLFLFGVSTLFSYTVQMLNNKEQEFKKTYDKERQYRYELERTKMQLMNSAKQVVHIAEIKERNRIARDIHDHVGHGIAGILMQLQVVSKLYDRDQNKSKVLLQKSIEELAKALDLLRDTVHNLRPKEELGIQYIQEVIKEFRFCPIEFNHTGDFNSVSPNMMEVLSTNIKEALTNAGRYSKGTKVNISIQINERYVRLYIKDNGVGCKNIKEGLGLSGMKERVTNMGGSISISSEDGFLIVCIIPREQEEREGIHEGINR